MSYTYQSAMARGRTLDSVWQTVDLSAIDINVMYQTYSKVFVTLTNPIYPDPVYLDMDAVRSMIPLSLPGPTIPHWLATLGTQSLPTTTSAPTYNQQKVIFGDAWRAGYSIKPVSMGANPNAQLPDGALNDLYLSKSGVDYGLLSKRALVSVNGYIHNTVEDANGLYVVDGMTTMRNCDMNQVGILSFENIADLTVVPITPSMILNRAGVEPYSGYVRVNLGQSLSGMSLLFVMGGHLHCFDEAYTITGDSTVRINMDRLPWAQIFYDTLNKIDTSSITWNTTPNNPEQITTNDLFSDMVISKFLQLSQTFFVLVNTPDMYLVRHYATGMKLPGRWLCAQGLQTYPMVGPMGRIIEYFPVWENEAFVLRSASQFNVRYMFETTDWRTQKSIAPRYNPRWRYSFPTGILLELGSEQLNIPTS